MSEIIYYISVGLLILLLISLIIFVTKYYEKLEGQN